MTVAAVAWVTAAVCAVCAGIMWRLLAVRMEAVTRAIHELRGPLTAARLGLQLEIRSARQEPRRLRAIDLELGSAALALEDLGTARVASSAPSGRTWPHQPTMLGRPQELDVQELVLESVQAWRAAAESKNVELRSRWVGDGCIVLGDRLRLAQAMGNLIANAIEHGEGSVEVRGSLHHGRTRIEVLDSGRGLPAQVSELTRRVRLGRTHPDRQRRRAGRGRGLAIAAAVAKAHGGRLSSAPSERGARLVLELPVALQRSAASGHGPAAPVMS